MEEEQAKILWKEIDTRQDLAIEEEIKKALFTQLTKKAPGISRLNFKILRLLWGWDKERIVKLIQAYIQKGIQPPT